MAEEFTYYNSERIERLLKDILPTQESIVEASDVFLKFGREGFHQRLTNDWDALFKFFSAPEYVVKRQALLYLTNDILQKCKQTSTGVPEYLKMFKPVLLSAFKRLVDYKDEKNTEIAKTLVKIWADRKVYSRESIKEMMSVFEEANPKPSKIPESADKYNESLLPEGLIKVPHELIQYLDAVKDQNKWQEKTQEAEGKVQSSLKSSSFKSEDAQYNLDNYKRCLELEQKYRTNMLRSETDLMRELDKDHSQYTHMLKKIGGLMDSIDSLLDS